MNFSFSVNPQVLHAINRFSARDIDRKDLFGVHVRLNGVNVEVSATDARRLIQLTLPVTQIGNIPPTGFRIPSAFIDSLPKLGADCALSFDGKIINYDIGGSSLGISMQCEGKAGKFPDLRKTVLPEVMPTTIPDDVWLNIGYFQHAITALEEYGFLCGNETNKRFTIVKDNTKKYSPIIIQGENVIVLIMPMSNPIL